MEFIQQFVGIYWRHMMPECKYDGTIPGYPCVKHGIAGLLFKRVCTSSKEKAAPRHNKKHFVAEFFGFFHHMVCPFCYNDNRHYI